MTPTPTRDELAARYVFDPVPGTVHILDLVTMAKDGIYVKDKVSDYVIGMLVWAKQTEVISAWEGTLFQIPFVKGMKIRSGTEHVGYPFTDPDGKVLELAGRTLHGSDSTNFELSPLTTSTLKGHAQYSAWVQTTLYAGGAEDATTYARVRNTYTLKACDAYVNSVPYAPGPMSVPPTAGPSTPTPATSKRPTKKRPTKKRPTKKRPTKKRSSATADDHPSEDDASTVSDPPPSDDESTPHPRYAGKKLPSAFSNPPADDDESTPHPQYAGKTLPSFTDFLANVAADEPTADKPAAGEPTAEESAEESAAEEWECAAEEIAVEEDTTEEVATKEDTAEEVAAKEVAAEEVATEEVAAAEVAVEEVTVEECATKEPRPAADDPSKKRKRGISGGTDGGEEE
jgi:hypothetical protein